MSVRWWQLPGARHFIDEVSTDLRVGRNVVLCLPPHAPRPIEFRQALFDVWSSAEDLSIAVNLQDHAELKNFPLKFLYSYFSISLHGSRKDGDYRNSTDSLDITCLLENESFTGKIIWIDGIDLDNRDTWCEFLEEYEQKARNQDSILSRTVFIFSFENEITIYPPEEGLCLKVRKWQGIIDSFDALLYAASLYRTDNVLPVNRQVAISTIANLSLWDLTMAAALATEHLKDLMAPREMLISIAREKGWSHRDMPNEWHLGTIDEFDGAKCLHSALLADTSCQTLKKRLWKAQVTILLPFVEERRHEFLSAYSEELPGWLHNYKPINNEGEPITQIHELELSSLYYIFKQAKVGVVIQENTRYLRDIRNKLAHFQAVDWQDLLELERHFTRM